jgi:hypothetical protein
MDDDIKMDFKEIVYESVHLIHLALVWGQAVSSYEHANEASCHIIGRQFTD